MRMKRGKGERLTGDSVQAMGMLAPMMLGFVIFTYVPIVYILRYSLYNSNGFKESWVGLNNFVRLFTRDATYWKSLVTTFILAFGKLLIEIPLAMILALLLNKGIKGTGFFRVTLFLPAIISTAICGLIFSLMFASYNGIINTMLQNWGWIQKPISWFSNRWTALLVLGLASVWNNFGINMIFFLMALQSVPKELYESASIDGITPVRRFFSITLPMIAGEQLGLEIRPQTEAHHGDVVFVHNAAQLVDLRRGEELAFVHNNHIASAQPLLPEQRLQIPLRGNGLHLCRQTNAAAQNGLPVPGVGTGLQKPHG